MPAPGLFASGVRNPDEDQLFARRTFHRSRGSHLILHDAMMMAAGRWRSPAALGLGSAGRDSSRDDSRRPRLSVAKAWARGLSRNQTSISSRIDTNIDGMAALQRKIGARAGRRRAQERIVRRSPTRRWHRAGFSSRRRGIRRAPRTLDGPPFQAEDGAEALRSHVETPHTIASKAALGGMSRRQEFAGALWLSALSKHGTACR